MQLSDVAHHYDKAAAYYDWVIDPALGRVLGMEKYRKRTIALLGDLQGATVLDVGCGTGSNFPLLAPRVGYRGSIIGLDY